MPLAYLALGGGLGDVVWDFLHHRLTPFLPGLVRDFSYRIRVITCCHNDGVVDLFKHHPWVHEHVTEQWNLPSEGQEARFNGPIDDFFPLRDSTLAVHTGQVIVREIPRFYLSADEQAWADDLLSQRPVITLQPYAGLSDRDGFDDLRLGHLCEYLVALDPDVRVLVLGKNHERGHKYTHETCTFEHPRVINLIDRVGIRVGIYLVERSDAFAGAHSNLVRTAWDARRRNACVMPSPSMTDALHHIDAKYLYGFNHPETRAFTYGFANGGLRHFEQLDTLGIARHLLGR